MANKYIYIYIYIYNIKIRKNSKSPYTNINPKKINT